LTATDAPNCTVDFEPIGKRVIVARGTTLLDAAAATGVRIASLCGGQGTCGRCRVVIVQGDTSPESEPDRHFLSGLELSSGQRLACQTHVLGDVKIYVPKESLVSDQRLQLEGVGHQMQIEPAVCAHALYTREPSLHDPRSDLERVSDTLKERAGRNEWTAEPAVVRTLSPLARRTGWQLTAYTRGGEIVGFAAPGRKPLGFACDVGTTKVAGYLVDLETGEDLAAAGVMNPQIGFGEDVISRLVRATRDPEGPGELARAIRTALNELIGRLTAEAGVGRDQVVEASIVGNTAMTHLLLELPVLQLALAPFVAAASAALEIKARDLGLEMAAGAYVHVLPCVRGFVGADHVAMILASDLDRKPHVAIGVDIGTNTEIALTRPDRRTLTSASCASGPAFEGAHISHGMRAATGAIETVHIESGGIRLKTIGNAAPVGLCGSGIVDAIAEMHRTGVISDRGRIQANIKGVHRTEKGLAYVIVPAAESGTGREIIIAQHDVSEIQLAKGAVAAGMESLIEATGTKREEIEEVIIAGAFGTYLNLESALAIGLLPRLPNAKYVQVGNAAGVGAKIALLSLSERERARRIAKQASYVELTTFTNFNRNFVKGYVIPKLPAYEDA
jgi:uncharacterized 2Fe-2S/4Fe-4S cluster protein (DUF4445 family)